MKRAVKIGFPIACVVIVGGTLIALNNLQNKVEKISKNKEKIQNSVNQTYENRNTSRYEENYIKNTTNIKSNSGFTTTNIVINDITTKNTVLSNENTTKLNSKTNTVKTEKSESKKEVSDKDKAISMAQTEWGSDPSVIFTFEGKSGSNYIVAVRDKSNTSVKMFYKVNLDANTIEIDW